MFFLTKLLIAEKPSVAKDIANILGNFKSKNGYLENSEYHITWALGHLIELAPPDDYVGTSKWSMDNLPIIPDNFKLNISEKTVSQFNVINQLIKKNSYEYVICATDAGREGELIFRYIYKVTECSLPVKRLWISSMAPDDIKKGFENLLDGQAKDNLALAAYCRAEADWLVGMNGTRAMSVNHKSVLSVGRVQTPTLAIIVKRENEIKNFVPKPYWEVEAFFESLDKQYKGKYCKDDNYKIETEAEAREISNAVTDNTGIIESVNKKKGTESPPKLYNLTDLQRECNKKYGLSAAKTLEILQKLYEEFKYTTYPRTDSNHLATAQIPTFPKILNNLQMIPELTKFTKPLLELPKLPVNKKFVDDSKLSDHHAIIPTDQKPNLKRLNSDQLKVYMLIARRFIAVFYGPCKSEKTTIMTNVDGFSFKTTGKVVIDPGWTIIYASEPKDKGETKDKEEKEDREDREDKDLETLPKVRKGDEYRVSKAEILTKETKKPSQFTEDSLLGAMETAGKLIEDEELRAKMKGMSLGTPATRAAIIETLIGRQYIERKGKKLIPTEKGIRLIELVPLPELKQPELTAEWEKRLANIEKGQDTRPEFMEDIKHFTTELVSTVKGQSSGHTAPGNITDQLCPNCQKPLAVREGKYGKFLACTGYPECKYTCKIDDKRKNIITKKSKNSAQRLTVGNCPRCGAPVIRGNSAWGCIRIKDNKCLFKILFKQNNIMLNDNHARQLLSPLRRTELIKGFYNEKESTNFDAYCELDASNTGSVKLIIE